MDGNGNGSSADNDLTKSQTAALGSDYHDFIVTHKGDDLSKSGLPINNYGASAETENLYRAVTQFVGAARGGWGDAKWTVTIGTEPGTNMPACPGGASSCSGGPSEQSRHMFFYTQNPELGRPSNISRAIIHESRHRGESANPLVRWFGDQIGFHSWLDHRARSLNMAYGFGKCDAAGNFPACGGWW